MVNVRDEQPEPLVVPLSTDGSEALTFDVGGISGWAAYHSAEIKERGVYVLLRVGPESSALDAPIEVRELRLTADTDKGSVFNSPLLRTIPFARIVAAVNRPTVVEELRSRLALSNMVMDGDFPGSGQWAYVLPPRKKTTLRPRLRVKDPGTRRKPDDFYKRIGALYLDQASISDRPAQDIAEANGLPVTTVHRWLKEARNRGLLRLPHQQGGPGND
jgi:hypothetical protein